MTDTLSTEVIGYRQWHITPDLTLRAAHKRDQVWTVGTNTAVCKPHDVPDPETHEYHTPEPCAECPSSDHECGIYALHDPSDFWYGKGSSYYNMRAIWDTGNDPLVSGVIAAWGAMEVHHSGFRTQHARVVALALPETKRDAAVARAVANAYGVPLVPVDELPRIAAEFGSTVPVEMRPTKPEPTLTSGGMMVTFNGAYSGGGLTAKGQATVYSKLMQSMLYGVTPSPPKPRRSLSFSLDDLGLKADHLLWTPEATDKAKTKAIEATKPDLTSFRRPTYNPLDFLPKRKGGRK